MLIPLKESCLRILTAHSSGLKDVGNCVYDLIRPVLLGCPPDQLAEIEDLSPHLMLESDEIWLLHLKRDYPHEFTQKTAQIKLELESYPSKTMNPYTNEEIELPIHRIKYFTIKESKEKALANASARLRERTQANRSEFSKRKAIFTGETDRGQFRNKRLNPNQRNSSYQSKSLAEKARQQVKKSCAVYANASRSKTPIDSQQAKAIPRPSSSSLRSISSTSASIQQSSSADQKSTPRSHVNNPNIIVKVVPSKHINPPDPSTRIIKPTPFRSNSKAPLIKVVRPIIPIPRTTSTLNPQLTKESLPIIGSSSNLNLYKPNPTSNPSSNSVTSSTSNLKKPSSLFMPKTKKPPPPTPLRSIVSVPINQTTTSTRMSRPPPPNKR